MEPPGAGSKLCSLCNVQEQAALCRDAQPRVHFPHQGEGEKRNDGQGDERVPAGDPLSPAARCRRKPGDGAEGREILSLGSQARSGSAPSPSPAVPTPLSPAPCLSPPTTRCEAAPRPSHAPLPAACAPRIHVGMPPAPQWLRLEEMAHLQPPCKQPPAHAPLPHRDAGLCPKPSRRLAVAGGGQVGERRR